MDPWDLQELRALWCVSSPPTWTHTLRIMISERKDFSEDDTTTAIRLFLQWGPNVRNIFNIMGKTPLERYSAEERWARQAREGARLIANHGLDIFFHPSQHSDLRASSVVFVRRGDSNPRTWHLYIPTFHLKEILAVEVFNLDMIAKYRFFHQLESYEYLLGSAGYLFETYVHATLCCKHESRFLAITQAGDQNVELVHPKRVVAGTLYDLRTTDMAEGRFYWKPSQRDFPGVDAVLVNKKRVFALQISVSKTHRDAFGGLLQIKTNLHEDLKDFTLYLVFVSNAIETGQFLRDAEIRRLEMLDTTSKYASLQGVVVAATQVVVRECANQRLTAAGKYWVFEGIFINISLD